MQIGSDGVLVLLGGSGHPGSVFWSRFEPGAVLSNITIYVIHTRSWLWQPVTSAIGQVPILRKSYFMVGLQGRDKSTFETRVKFNSK